MKSNNPFFNTWNECGLPPFNEIKLEHYEPAIMRGIELHDAEIAQITTQTEPPTFDNTIVALERSGWHLNRVLNVFYPMLSACADDALMSLSLKLAPILTNHSNSITHNTKLWERVKQVCDQCDEQTMSREDVMLLKKTRESFERSGATLPDTLRKHHEQLTNKLTELTLKFEQNHLREMSSIEMWLTHDDLSGLPETAIEAARDAAAKHGREGEYLITLHAPSYVPFMKYSARRDLRQKLYMLYNTQCTGGDYDNTKILIEIANTRLELANLFGCKNYAEYRLKYSMAQSPERVYEMLNRLKDAYAPAMKAEMETLTQFASSLEGHHVTIMPWDYSYYANKHREKLYNFNDEVLRPYFRLENVIEGVFGLATKLYGLHFNELTRVQIFDPDVKVYSVMDDNGRYMGTIYTDFFPRSTKQSGAWMTNFGEQYHDAAGNDVRPIVTLTMNFTRPTPSKPSLLTYSEVNTFLHEFGHGLHSLLSHCKYTSTSGTNVYRDFVEMPSQFHENYLRQREFLDSFAHHYLTGDPIPQEYIDNITASSQYGAGYACMRQLGFGYIDMAWHSITEPFSGSVSDFECEALRNVKVFDAIDGCIMSPQFGHIFSGGYAAGYYGYKWAEVLDADAFSVMEKEGVFNRQATSRLVDNILSRGSSDEAMTLYTSFLGREPSIDALLRRDGIKQTDDMAN